jgi:hypothetical protein
MARLSRFLPLGRVLACFLLGSFGAALAGVAVPTANATFPGSNGKIAVTTVEEVGCGDCSYDFDEVWTLGANGRATHILAAGGVEFSPSGTRLAYVDADETGVWIARHDGSRGRLLARGASNPAWSPSGRLLAYWDAGGHLLVASADGRTKWRLPNGFDFAWSPSGGQLAITNNRSVKIVGFRGRYARTVATADPVPLGSPSPFGNLAWSAAGWLSYVRDGTLFVLPRSGGLPRALDPGQVLEYAWAPDGRRVAFTRTDGMWVMSVPDGTPRLLAPRRQIGSRTELAWSPDGRLVAWVRDRSPRYSVYTVSADGGPSKLFGSFNDEGDGYTEVVDLDWQARPRT